MARPTISRMAVEQTDVAIVGAGPIGLEMAVALKRRGIRYVHFDARQIGYTISWFAPQTRFFSSNERIAIAGVPLETPDQTKSTREQYLTYLRSVVRLFDLQVRTYEPVVGIERQDGEFLITTHPAQGEKQLRANRLILATGGTDKPRRLGIPGEDLPHVSHNFRDPHEYFGRRLLIVGGKNSAVEAALRCHHAGAKVAISYRRNELDARSIKYWLTPEISSLIKEGRIEAYFGTVPVKIGRGEVELQKTRDEGTKRQRDQGGNTKREDVKREEVESSCAALYSRVSVPADFVLLLIGYLADVSLLRLAGVELIGECQSPRYDAATMETNVPGLYVAGTATGGTQDKYSLFIENCHVHVERIIAAITGNAPPETPLPLERAES
jgi:thioredoxin reductase (NADPH)